MTSQSRRSPKASVEQVEQVQAVIDAMVAEGWVPWATSLDEPEEEQMPDTSEAPPIAQPAKAEQPRQPTRDENKRIVEFIEINFDREQGRWCSNLSDHVAACTLNLPRAWVHAHP